jgi:hypothetical protein
VNLESYVSGILETYGKGTYYDEIKRAKEHYFSRAFKVAEGSDRYESELNQFFDWFVFERNLEREDLPPIRLFLRDEVKDMSADKKKIFDALGNSFSSVFELLKIKDDEAVIKDLFDKETYVVEEIDNPKIFQKGDIFQARLVPFDDKIVFSMAFLFHPKEAKQYLKKEIKKVKNLRGENKREMMLRLTLMKHRSEQYPHIDVSHIYSEKPII